MSGIQQANATVYKFLVERGVPCFISRVPVVSHIHPPSCMSLITISSELFSKTSTGLDPSPSSHFGELHATQQGLRGSPQATEHCWWTTGIRQGERKALTQLIGFQRDWRRTLLCAPICLSTGNLISKELLPDDWRLRSTITQHSAVHLLTRSLPSSTRSYPPASSSDLISTVWLQQATLTGLLETTKPRDNAISSVSTFRRFAYHDSADDSVKANWGPGV